MLKVGHIAPNNLKRFGKPATIVWLGEPTMESDAPIDGKLATYALIFNRNNYITGGSQMVAMLPATVRSITGARLTVNGREFSIVSVTEEGGIGSDAAYQEAVLS